MVADNYRSVRGKGVTCGEGGFAADGHLFDLAILSEPSEDQVVNLFCGDVGESRPFELGHHVLIIAAAHLGGLNGGLCRLVGAVACREGGGQNTSDNQGNNSSHGDPQGVTSTGVEVNCVAGRQNESPVM